MPVVRFPNSQSDVDRFVSIFSALAVALEDRTTFSLDDMRDVLAETFQISSSGTSGAAAVAKSTRDDRSRDPLYNQVKMMSEIYRMLGWIRSTPEKRLEFTLTTLGAMIGIDAASHGESFKRALVCESIMSVTFPNATTTNLGVKSARPFANMLLLAHDLDGVITRDEIIIGVLAVIDDDAQPRSMMVKQLRTLRGKGVNAMAAAIDELASANDVQINTLQNYTRLPIGVLSSVSLNLASPVSVKGLYGTGSMRAFALTENGADVAKDLAARVDLRATDLKGLSLEDRASLANLAFYTMLSRAGIDDTLIAADLDALRIEASSFGGSLGIAGGTDFIFNPELQETDEVLARAQARKSF